MVRCTVTAQWCWKTLRSPSPRSTKTCPSSGRSKK
uniref:Uncharacterized protein n=1 Tax=Anguilla anguilla TaxID=7936 RepID=A0A0E9RE87_ANGAN